MTPEATNSVNYYEVLGASPMDQIDRIEDLFRQLAYDAQQSGDHSQIPIAVEAFKTLRDPAQRHQYDLRLSQQHEPNTQPAVQAQSHAAQAADPSAASNHFMPAQTPQAEPTAAPAAMAQSLAASSMPMQQPAVSIPNVQPQTSIPTEAPVTTPVQNTPVQNTPAASAATANPTAAPTSGALPPPEFCAATAQRRRREVLAMFYKRRRDDAKNPGIAIGGIEQKVDYTFEVLEFHLWYMQQREWLLRLESGMFTITYLGVEEHEKNLIAGLIR
jgi:hypothetical protein